MSSLHQFLRNRLMSSECVCVWRWGGTATPLAGPEQFIQRRQWIVFQIPLWIRVLYLLYTVRKMDLLLRCIQRRLQMQLSMARKFTLQPYRR
jgi:hypothetical protein